jgi:protein SCO1
MMTRRNLLAQLGATSVGAIGLSAWAATPPGQASTPPGGARAHTFPNATLLTHEGKEVRFYDDLIRGKTVLINMMYAQCSDRCPPMTQNLRRVQDMLGNRVGGDVHMYSITLLPEQDRPQDLKDYAKLHGVKPGWTFLTGRPDDIERIRKRLGFYERDPKLDTDITRHTGMIRIGNETLDRWCTGAALGVPSLIVDAIKAVMPQSRTIA